MKGDDLPDTDHVVRYIKPTLIHNGVVTGTAFCARDGETDLSANWIEYFSGHSLDASLSEIRRCARLTFARNGKLAKLNVGKTKSYVLAESVPQRTIFMKEDPLDATASYPADPSHARIGGVPTDGDSPEAEAVGDLIAACIETLFPAIEPVQA